MTFRQRNNEFRAFSSLLNIHRESGKCFHFNRAFYYNHIIAFSTTMFCTSSPSSFLHSVTCFHVRFLHQVHESFYHFSIQFGDTRIFQRPFYRLPVWSNTNKNDSFFSLFLSFSLPYVRIICRLPQSNQCFAEQNPECWCSRLAF